MQTKLTTRPHQDVLQDREKIACFSFDEIKLKEVAVYDKKLDQIVGPYAYGQKVYVRSIFGEWKFPVFVDFDTAITKFQYNDTIFQLEAIGIKIVMG